MPFQFMAPSIDSTAEDAPPRGRAEVRVSEGLAERAADKLATHAVADEVEGGTNASRFGERLVVRLDRLGQPPGLSIDLQLAADARPDFRLPISYGSGDQMTSPTDRADSGDALEVAAGLGAVCLGSMTCRRLSRPIEGVLSYLLMR